MLAIFFKESRGNAVLSQKAKRLNKWIKAREDAGLGGFGIPVEGEIKFDPQRIRWKVRSDEERETTSKILRLSLQTSFRLLFTEPVVFSFSLWVAFAWVVLYLTFASLPLVFTTTHGFNVEQNGAVFASMCVGAILATILSIYQERIARRFGVTIDTPERRLYFACIESAFLPIGLFLFGWTSFPQIHWVFPTMGIALATMGIFSIYFAVYSYFSDTYGELTNPALAAQSFGRNILAGVAPLFANKMFLSLGFPWASTVLGVVATGLTLVPWALVYYGKRIRARSRLANKSAAGSETELDSVKSANAVNNAI